MIVHLLPLLLLAFAVSLDGFGVGVTYGLRQIRIPVISVIIIAICSGCVIWLSMLAGNWITTFLSPAIARFLGAFILIGIGCWALAQLYLSRKERGEHERHDRKDDDRLSMRSPVGDEALATLINIELKRFGLVIQILRTPQAADVDRSGTISSSEAVLLGLALSLDALGAGLGAAMLGFSPLLTAVFIALASGFFLLTGMRVGMRFASLSGVRAFSVLPGLILIVMGITRLL
jgi:putative sporulation protein YtaF